MARSHKDRGKWDLPRVPEWARAKPEQVMEDRRKKLDRREKRKQERLDDDEC